MKKRLLKLVSSPGDSEKAAEARLVFQFLNLVFGICGVVVLLVNPYSAISCLALLIINLIVARYTCKRIRKRERKTVK